MTYVSFNAVPDIDLQPASTFKRAGGETVHTLPIAKGVHLFIEVNKTSRTIVRSLIEQLTIIERRIAADLDEKVVSAVVDDILFTPQVTQ